MLDYGEKMGLTGERASDEQGNLTGFTVVSAAAICHKSASTSERRR